MYLRFLFPSNRRMAQFLICIAKVECRGLKRVVLTKYSSLVLEPLKCINFICPSNPSPCPLHKWRGRVRDGFKNED
jgi:hypothetical protein